MCSHVFPERAFPERVPSVSRFSERVPAHLSPPHPPPQPQQQQPRPQFFKKEIQFLPKTNTIVTLGKIAFDACLNFYKQDYEIKRKDFVFKHLHRL